MRLHAYGIHDTVRPAPRRRCEHDVDRAVRIDRTDAVTLGHGAALRDGVDGDHVVAEVASYPGGELADRPEAEDDEAAAVGNVGILHALPGRGQDVAEEQIALIGQVTIDHDRVLVRQRRAVRRDHRRHAVRVPGLELPPSGQVP